jgi:hypothetical protein
VYIIAARMQAKRESIDNLHSKRMIEAGWHVWSELFAERLVHGRCRSEPIGDLRTTKAIGSEHSDAVILTTVG